MRKGLQYKYRYLVLMRKRLKYKYKYKYFVLMKKGLKCKYKYSYMHTYYPRRVA